MATLENKRKLAAVSREAPEGSRGSRAQNALDPELTQDYISQVSEEIEGRALKKLSKEFSKVESRLLGALSKLDELLLNPQVRTCSLAVPGTSRNSNSENRENTGDRSSDDPYPEMGSFFITLVNSTDQSQKPTLTIYQKLVLQSFGLVDIFEGKVMQKNSVLVCKPLIHSALQVTILRQMELLFSVPFF